MSWSKKEKIYAVYIAKNKEIIEKIIRNRVIKFELEKNYENRKVDIYGISEDKSDEVFIELQITKADSIHFEQIKNIVENINDGGFKIIIWIAKDFEYNMFENLKEIIEEANKNIVIMCIKINEKVIEKLEELNTIDDFEIVDNFSVLDKIEEQLEIVYAYFHYDRLNDIYRDVPFRNLEIEDNNMKVKFLIRVIDEIRKQSYYFLPAYHSKNIAGNKIVYGAGTTTIIIQIGIDRWCDLYIETVFEEPDIYEKLKSRKDEYDDIFDYRLVWNDSMLKIGIYMKFDEKDIERQSKEVARVFDKFLKCLIKDLKENILNK